MRIPVAIAAATALGLALAGCSNSEEPSTVKGTNPTVITGDQGAPGGQAEGHGDEGEAGGAGDATATLIDVNGRKIGTAEFTKAGNGVKIVVNVAQGDAGIPRHAHPHQRRVRSEVRGAVLQRWRTPAGRWAHRTSVQWRPGVDLHRLERRWHRHDDQRGRHDQKQIIGKSLVIHAGADNFGNIPDRYSADGKPGPDEKTLATGDAGGRAACGVIDAD